MLLLSIATALSSRVLCSFSKAAPSPEWRGGSNVRRRFGKDKNWVELCRLDQPKESEMGMQGEGNSSRSVTFFMYNVAEADKYSLPFWNTSNAIIFNLCFSDYNSLHFIKVYFAIREVSFNVPYTILMK